MFKKINKYNKGTTYVELIVVLSIFAVMSSVVLFKYVTFQAKIDIKNLGGDIALKIVEAQKSSVGGKFPPVAQQLLMTTVWKPSYGIYFNLSADNKSFVYFSDLDGPTLPVPPQNGLYDGTSCSQECLEKITITKGNYVSRLDVFYQDGTTSSLNDMTITFKRPSSTAVIKSTQLNPPFLSPISYAQITISSPSTSSMVTAKINIYPSGRIEIK